MSHSEAANPLPRVGIVLVNYNGRRFLPECIASLKQIDYPSAVVVVIDNASSDGSVEWLEENYPDVPLICHAENSGITGGNNAGIRWCLKNGCEWIMLLNNDTEVEPDFLSQLMQHAAPKQMMAPRIFYADNRNRINNHFGSFDYLRGIHRDRFYNQQNSAESSQLQQGTMANTCALLFPRTLPESIGWQDDNYFIYYDDIDYITRAVQCGYGLLYVPEAVIYHKESSSSGGANSPLVTYYTVRNRLYFMQQYHKRSVGWLVFLAYFTLTRCALFIRLAMRRDTGQIKIILRAIQDFFGGKMGKADPSRYMLPLRNAQNG